MLAKLSGKYRRCCAPRLLISALALGLLTLAPLNRASAVTFKSLYSFCQLDRCHDGRVPRGTLRVAPHGVIYGATALGGAKDGGVFFKLRRGTDGTWRETSRFAFCKSDPGICAGGFEPAGGVVIDVAGNVYGLTRWGGADGGGVAYELSPPAPGNKGWSEKVLYSFCSQASCTDGTLPAAELTYAGAQTGIPYDGVSPLYGITEYGGIGVGALFSLTPPAHSEDPWTEKVLYAFCAQPGCTDGHVPIGNPLIGADGAIYGVTGDGGTYNAGIIYEFKNQTFTALYSFCSAMYFCNDGGSPAGGLVMDAQGNLFGMTQWGSRITDTGLIYELSLAGSEPKYRVLFNFTFCGQGCPDGAGPSSQLALDSKGRLYGVTTSGGLPEDGGVAFVLDGASFSVLHDFCAEANCADGKRPEAGPVFGGAGYLFGTTAAGGAHNAGTVYELTLQDKERRGR